jgi:hypothetical protein
LNADRKTDQKEILDYIEAISAEIQLLALNIAVAAAKLAHNNKIGIEVNQNLSNLVNQATQAVKHMNQIIDAAKTEKSTNRFSAEVRDEPVDKKLIENIESAMGDIIRNSERIVRLLANVKKR